MHILALLALCCAAVAAIPANHQRIIGGSVTTIDRYPTIASLIFTRNTYMHSCGGTILNNRSVLSAAHCAFGTAVAGGVWRIRVGSAWANSGGVVHYVNLIIIHPEYNANTLNNDICIFRSASTFSFNNNVRAAFIANFDYNLADNEVVWAAGWGVVSQDSNRGSIQLRHVELRSINQDTCRNNYTVIGDVITDNMLCSGWLSGGRDQCRGDSGGPLYHNGVVVGVCSFGHDCAQAAFPGVNTRVSRYTTFIYLYA